MANLFDSASPAIQHNMLRDVREMVHHETGESLDEEQAVEIARKILRGAKSREALYRVSTVRLRRLIDALPARARRAHSTKRQHFAGYDFTSGPEGTVVHRAGSGRSEFARGDRVEYRDVNLTQQGTVASASGKWVMVRWDGRPFESREWGPNLRRVSGAAHATKKTSKQLDGEINDILIARQKREAREARERASSSPRSAGIPSQAEYERRELSEARKRIQEIERASLADRKEAAAEFLGAMQAYPQLVAERVGWLLAGNYGYGPMLLAKRILGSPRMNRSAALTQLAGAFEWQSPEAMTRASWKKLTRAQQAALERAVQGAIRDAEREE